jgi:hypothetical protein
MDLLKGELGSYSDTCVTSNLGRNEVTGVAAERVSDIKEDDQEPTTIPEIKAEPKVNCMPVVSVTHVSYRLYPELTVLVKKNLILENGFEQFLRK